MTSNLPNSARRLLIRSGKALPFVLCFVVCIAYAESAFAVTTGDYLTFGDTIVPNTPISFAIAAKFFEYDWLITILVGVISLAIEACKWNIFAVLYLFLNLFEKTYFDFELEENTIIAICAANVAVSGYLTYTGIKILIE